MANENIEITWLKILRDKQKRHLSQILKIMHGNTV